MKLTSNSAVVAPSLPRTFSDQVCVCVDLKQAAVGSGIGWSVEVAKVGTVDG